MNMYDIILKKRNGKLLTRKEIFYLVEGFTKGEIPDYQMSAFLMTLYFRKMEKDEILYLTEAMLASGEILNLSDIDGITVDKHSTGGVGDKVSLIAGPIAAAAGCKVVKMSGRGLGFTGGTIDKLRAIKGFNTDISLEEFKHNIKKSGFSLISQKENIAKADKLIYALRDVTGTVDIMPLIASSIMSKKLALNADAIVLDVKYGQGALMKTLKEAEILGEMMKEIGSAKGKMMSIVYSDMSEPLGREIGNRNEVIESIELLKGNLDGKLLEESVEIAGHMILLCNLSKDISESKKIAKNMIDKGYALNKFKEFIENQGGDAKVIENYKIMPEPLNEINITGRDLLKNHGKIKKIDAEKVGIACVKTGAGRSKKTDDIDYSAGISLKKLSGERFDENTVIATVFGNSKSKLIQAALYLTEAFEIEE